MHALAAYAEMHGEDDGLCRDVNNLKQAQRDMTSVGPSPCDTCQLRQRCGEKLLACHAFYQYTEINHWEARHRTGPTRALYRAIQVSS